MMLRSQVNGPDSTGGTSYRTETLWSEEGSVRAGSRQNMRKGQVYRASPPADLAEALDRQRRLLHGQDLRNYWNFPKVLILLLCACAGSLQLPLRQPDLA